MRYTTITNHHDLLQCRYKVGQRFGRHIDESVDLGDGKRTYYTLLVYLSGGLKSSPKNVTKSQGDLSVDPLVGGETVFYGSRNSVVAEVGRSVLFLNKNMDRNISFQLQNKP